MTEGDAKTWLLDRFGASAVARLEGYERALLAASEAQNLIAASTVPAIWSRHFVDSAQLIGLAPERGVWVDIGAGAGLPGLVVAALSERQVILIEPRRLRAAFLMDVASSLGLAERVQIIQAKAQNAEIASKVAVVSARAVATIDRLLDAAAGFADCGTTYILPKGANAQSEVANARRTWHGAFHVKHSILDPLSQIVVVTGVSRR